VAVPGALLIAGSTLTVLLDSTAGLALGIVALLAFVALSYGALAIPPEHDA
jgi:hypothetical protein